MSFYLSSACIRLFHNKQHIHLHHTLIMTRLSWFVDLQRVLAVFFVTSKFRLLTFSIDWHLSYISKPSLPRQLMKLLRIQSYCGLHAGFCILESSSRLRCGSTMSLRLRLSYSYLVVLHILVSKPLF